VVVNVVFLYTITLQVLLYNPGLPASKYPQQFLTLTLGLTTKSIKAVRHVNLQLCQSTSLRQHQVYPGLPASTQASRHAQLYT